MIVSRDERRKVKKHNVSFYTYVHLRKTCFRVLLAPRRTFRHPRPDYHTSRFALRRRSKYYGIKLFRQWFEEQSRSNFVVKYKWKKFSAIVIQDDDDDEGDDDAKGRYLRKTEATENLSAIFDQRLFMALGNVSSELTDKVALKN